MKIQLALLFIWLAAVGLGVIRPQVYLPLVKWNMKLMSKISGTAVVPEPDDKMCRSLRIWYSSFFVLGMGLLYMILTGRAK